MPRAIATLSASLLLAGCVSVLPQGRDLAPRLGLDPGYGEAAKTGERLEASLTITDPRADAVFNTSSVAVQTAPMQYEYLEDAEWTDRAPLLLGRFLERRFENAGRFDAVGDSVSLPVADYALHTDLRALNVDLTGGRSAVIAYGARLTDRRGRTVGSRVFRADVPLDGGGNEAVVASLNEAAARVADETVAWVSPLIRADRAEEAARDAAQSARRSRG